MLPKHSKHAFTMIELIFVIIVIGILAAVAIPKFSGIENQAVISSGRATVMSVRAAISTFRQKGFMLGNSSYISSLDAGVAVNTSGVKIFDNNGTTTDTLLTYPIITKSTSGGWIKTAINQYTYYVDSTPVPFTYNPNSGIFTCTTNSTTAGKDCSYLSQ
jgi:general secretion pathway protein G